MSPETKQLYHVRIENNETFLKRIDECGGWPHNAKSVVSKHVCEHEIPCYFSTEEDVRDEWNTSILTADDYYWWKISKKKKDLIEQELRRKISREIL